METKVILAAFAVACTLIAFGLCCASAAIPVWWNLPDLVTIGLFRSCVTVNSVTICFENTEVSANFQATRWLVVGACALLGIALFLGLLLLCLRNGCLAVTGCIFDVVAGLCVLAAVIISAVDKSNSDLGNVGYGISFILACVAAAIAIIAGVIFAFAKPKKSGSMGRVIQPT